MQDCLYGDKRDLVKWSVLVEMAKCIEACDVVFGSRYVPGGSTDVRWPFTFEHAPVRAEGCTTCHTPHGTQNPRLLNMPSIATLCNQCHSPVAAGTVHGMGTGSAELQPCINCHTMIHGSNIDPYFKR